MATLAQYIIDTINAKTNNVTYTAYGGDDSTNMTSDGMYVYWTDDSSASILVFKVTRSGDSVSISKVGNMTFSNLTINTSNCSKVYVKNENKVLFFEPFNVVSNKVGYITGNQTSLSMSQTATTIANYPEKLGKRVLTCTYAPVTFNGIDGFWTIKWVSGGSFTETTVSSNASYVYCTGDFRNCVMLLECRNYSTLDVIKSVQFTVPASLPSGQAGWFGQEGIIGGFEVPGLLCMGIGDSIVIVNTTSGAVVGSVNLPLTGDTGRDMVFDLTNKVIVNDSGDASSEVLYVSRLDSTFNPFGNPPSNVTSVTPSATKAQVGKQITVNWSAVSTPTQPSGLDLDTSTVYYEVKFYNGSSWSTLSTARTTTSYTHTIAQQSDTTSAKFQVQPYVKLNGQKIYSSSAKSSATFKVYNNTAPTVSSDLTLSVGSGAKVKPLDKVTVSFTLGSDVDEGDTLTGQLEYWNGAEWISIAKDLAPVEGKVRFDHLIPAKAVTGAKYRAVTYDGNDKGEALESYTFDVLEPDADRKLPNMLELDGVDDCIEIPNNTGFNVGGSQVSIELLFQSSVPAPSGKSTMVFGKDGSMWFELRDNGTMDFFVTTDQGVKGVGSNQVLTDGTMKRLSATYDGTTIRFYVNGTLVNSIEHTGTVVDNTKPYTVGKPVSSTDYNSQFLVGKVGSFRVFNTVRTQEEIEANMMTELPKETPGLTFLPQFDAETGKLVCGKTGTTGEIMGGATWGYSFVPLEGVAVPFPLSPVRKENIDYIRTKVLEFRKANGLPEVVWTDYIIIKGLTPIKAVHINELTEAIRETYTLTGQVISDGEVKEVIEETVLTKDVRFRISDIGSRLEAIVRAITNN